jgi:hypothetical protein
MNKPNAVHSRDESLTAAAPQTRKYENIIAADNARQINGDVHGNIHIGDVHNYPSHTSMLAKI